MLNTHATQYTPHRCEYTNISFLGVNKRYSCIFFLTAEFILGRAEMGQKWPLTCRILSNHHHHTLHDNDPFSLIRVESPLTVTNAAGMGMVKPQGWELGYFSISYPQITQTKFITQRLSSFLKSMENKDFPTSSITTTHC